jgi:hypothetical protein
VEFEECEFDIDVPEADFEAIVPSVVVKLELPVGKLSLVLSDFKLKLAALFEFFACPGGDVCVHISRRSSGPCHADDKVAPGA